jgi:hypothetical protein
MAALAGRDVDGTTAFSPSEKARWSRNLLILSGQTPKPAWRFGRRKSRRERVEYVPAHAFG